MILTASHIGVQILGSAAPAVGQSGFSGATPGGRLMVIVGVAGLLAIGLVALVVSLRGSRLGTEGSRRARRGFGPDALDAAAGELRPSLTGGRVPAHARIPHQIPVLPTSPALPTSPVIPEEVRAWQERRESR